MKIFTHSCNAESEKNEEMATLFFTNMPFSQPLGLLGPPDHILQNIYAKLGVASFLVHMHIFN